MSIMLHSNLPAIAVENLKVTAKNDKGEAITLVSDIQFTVQRGEVLALIGESGSGKTMPVMVAR